MTRQENERRVSLIIKNLEKTITEEELEELESLQKLADKSIHKILETRIERVSQYQQQILKTQDGMNA